MSLCMFPKQPKLHGKLDQLVEEYGPDLSPHPPPSSPQCSERVANVHDWVNQLDRLTPVETPRPPVVTVRQRIAQKR